MVSPSTPCVCFSPVGAGVKITKGWIGYGLGMVGLHGSLCSLVLISAKLWSVAGVVLTLLVSLKIILLKTNRGQRLAGPRIGCHPAGPGGGLARW